MRADVIEIGEYAFRRKHRFVVTGDHECAHHSMIMDDDGHHVKCQDCGTQLSAYWVLGRMLDRYREKMRDLDHERQRLAALKAKDLSLIAAKKVEAAWRSRTTVPRCPHCYAGILPTDGFGGSVVSKALELRRREVARDQKAIKPERDTRKEKSNGNPHDPT